MPGVTEPVAWPNPGHDRRVRSPVVTSEAGTVPLLVQRLDPALPLPGTPTPATRAPTWSPARTCAGARCARRSCRPASRSPCPTGYAASCIRAPGSPPGTASRSSTRPGRSTPATAERSRSRCSTPIHRGGRLRRGDRIAQLVVQRVERAELVEVERLPGSDRGPEVSAPPASGQRSPRRPGPPHRAQEAGSEPVQAGQGLRGDDDLVETDDLDDDAIDEADEDTDGADEDTDADVRSASAPQHPAPRRSCARPARSTSPRSRTCPS